MEAAGRPGGLRLFPAPSGLVRVDVAAPHRGAAGSLLRSGALERRELLLRGFELLLERGQLQLEPVPLAAVPVDLRAQDADPLLELDAPVRGRARRLCLRLRVVMADVE